VGIHIRGGNWERKTLEGVAAVETARELDSRFGDPKKPQKQQVGNGLVIHP